MSLTPRFFCIAKKPLIRVASQTIDKKLFSPRKGKIALSADERIAEFLNIAIQAKFVHVNKLMARMRAAYLS